MVAASTAAEELRVLLVEAEKENSTDTDTAARIGAGIARLRRVLAPVAADVRTAKTEK